MGIKENHTQTLRGKDMPVNMVVRVFDTPQIAGVITRAKQNDSYDLAVTDETVVITERVTGDRVFMALAKDNNTWIVRMSDQFPVFYF